MSELTMQSLGETAAEQTTQAACGQPREIWIVTDKDGEMPRVCNSANEAETVRAYREIDLRALAPHRVTRFVEAKA